MIEEFLAFFGKIVSYGGGAAVISYLLFQFLGKSWIENKFAERLDQLKHQQTLELQRLRIEIDSLLSGALRLQEREFQILPEAWQKLDEAHGLVSWLVSPAQEYPDLDRMSLPRLEEFLATSELSETEKQEVRSSQRKGPAYYEIIFWHRLHKVRRAFGDLQQFVARNGIFFPPDLKVKFTKISDALWSALISKEVGHEAKDYKMQSEGWKKIKEETEPLYQSIETDIQARLQSHARRPPN